MPPIRLRRAAAAWAVVALLCASAPALADRKARPGERRAVQRLALKSCERRDIDCRRAAVRVSTVSSRYAFGGAQGGNFYDGALARRKGVRWKILVIQGGGIQDCKGWLRAAPRKVLRDLDIEGWSPQHPNGGPC